LEQSLGKIILAVERLCALIPWIGLDPKHGWLRVLMLMGACLKLADFLGALMTPNLSLISSILTLVMRLVNFNGGGEKVVVYKTWVRRSKMGLRVYRYEGWFVLGFIPVYIRRFSNE
jgi:hypothetical protein